MGYAVISADRRTSTILAMSDQGNIDFENPESNPGLDMFFANAEAMLEEQIATAEECEARLLDQALAKINGAKGASSKAEEPITVVYGDWEPTLIMFPRVFVKWGQDPPYNNNAPFVLNEYKVPVTASAGCVATAVAQVMSFHRYPTSIRWDIINAKQLHYPNEPEFDPAHAPIASLFRTIGDNVDMKWGVESGTPTSYAINHFAKMGYRNSGYMGEYEFDTIVNSIADRVPVIIRGSSIRYTKTYTHRHWFLGSLHSHTEISYDGNHAWVLDGYLERRRVIEFVQGGKVIYSLPNGLQRLVHCNFGWDGDDDGYYISEAFDTHKGPVTMSGEVGYFQFEFKCLYNVKP